MEKIHHQNAYGIAWCKAGRGLYYANFVYLNFEANTQLQAIFAKDFSPLRIITELSVLMGITIQEQTTLLFFDEIQANERALTSLKYFCEESPNYHIIAAGSLLGVALHREQYSFPVGKVVIKTLYPFDFEEFLCTNDSFGQSTYELF